MSIDFVPGDTVQVPEIPYADEVTLPIKKTALGVCET